ncbi:MAG: hypothetical protein M3R17_10005 [Bacteroidota bacterium]|nr:hypothetical protein [Bacteroidota bacterium]
MRNAFIFLLLIPFFSCMEVNADGTKISSQKDSLVTSTNVKWKYEDEFYTVYYLRENKIELRDKRPTQKDTAIVLCIPAAFTQLDDGSIDGLFIINGKITDRKKVNHHLGGGLLILDGKPRIFKTDDGKFLTESWKDSIVALNGSFLQQIQLVRAGDALDFNKDQKLFQRRAIVIYADSSVALVESKNRITLQEFADDMVKMKVIDAIYTDMGSYDEGWVRDGANGKIVVIGKNRMETMRQSNWLVFKKGI